MREHSISMGAVLLAVVSACHSEPSSTTTTTSSRLVSSDEAMTRLAKERCLREVTCNKVGRGKFFADRRACEHDLRERSNLELLERECPRGVLEKHLEDCLSHVRRETCGNPMHTAERIDICAGALLCVDD